MSSFRPSPILPLVRNFFSRAALFIALSIAAGGSLARANDMAIVEQRILAELSASRPADSTITTRMNALGSNGLFSGLVYTDPTQARTHLFYMRDMAKAYNSPASTHYLSTAVRDKYFQAFDGWVAADPTDPNWWWPEIAFPKALGEAMLLMKAHFSTARMNAGTTLIARAYRARSNVALSNVGANRTDRSYATMLRALLTNNGSLLSESFLSIGDAIEYTSGEGMQADGSYHQHGAQLYLGGYGLVFVNGVSLYANYGAGTQYTYSPRQIREFTDFMLDGAQWFLRGPLIDHSALGRSITRTNEGAARSALFLASLNSTKALAGSYRAAELDAMIARLEADRDSGAANPATALVGNRSFWRADTMTHHRPGFMASIKTASTRTIESEVINEEGKKSMHLSDGVLLIHRRGDEYTGIMPMWNWQRLPGTTIEQASYSLRPTGASTNWIPGTSTHAGGVSDGTDGAHAFIYSKRNVSARKSWFFVGDSIVALGAAINASASTSSVLTTLNQSYLKSPITYSTGGAPETLTTGSATPAGLRWVHHDGTGYFFFSPQDAATLRGQSQSGKLFDINGTASTSVYTDVQTADVFSLFINHGTGFTGGSYAYVVAPGLTAEAMPGYALGDLTVLSNTSNIQAVKSASRGLTLANFFGAGTVDGITVSHSCSLLVRERDGFLEITVSDPKQNLAGDLTIQVNRSTAGLIESDGGVVVDQFGPTLAVRFNMAGTTGRSLRAKFFTTPGAYTTLTLNPVADGDVLDGSGTANFGSATTLRTKFDSSTGDWSEAYLKFNLAGLPSSLVSARLVVTPTSLSTTPTLHSLSPVGSSAWTEGGLTWNNRPQPSGRPTALWMPRASEAVRADVRSFLPGALGADGALTLWFAPRQQSSALVTFASRENATAALRPKLELTFPASFAVDNSAGAVVTDGSVVLRGWMIGGTANVSIYWGTSDGGTNPANWANVISLPNSVGGAISGVLTNLAAGSIYHYRIFASGSQGSAWAPQSSTFVNPSAATVQLGTLAQTYDGNPRAVSVTTTPAGLAVAVTYDGEAAPPRDAGSYAVVATVTDPAHVGSASGTLVVARANPVVSSLPVASNLLVGQSLSASVLAGGAAHLAGTPVPGTFSFVAPSTVPEVGTVVAGVTFTPLDTTNFNAVTGLQVPVTVSANLPPFVDAGFDQFRTLNQVGAWTPSATATAAWYDAADPATLTASAGAVSAWADKSGNANHLRQSAAGAMPMTGTRTLGGLNVVAFNAANDNFLDAAHSSSLNFDASGGLSTFIVFRTPGYNDQGGGSNNVFGKGSPFSTAGVPGFGLSYNSSINANYKFADADVRSLALGTSYVGSPLLFTTVANHVTGEGGFHLNGGSLSIARSVTPPRLSDSPGDFRLGGVAPTYPGGPAYNTATRFADIDVGELILVPGVPSLANQQRFEGYLAHKWGLAASLPEGHPHKSQAPSRPVAIATLTGSASDAPGQALTHAWSFVAGPAPVTFADASSLSTTATFAAEGIYTLRLSSSDGVASASDEIVVTVGAAPPPSPFAVWAGATAENETAAFGADANGDKLADGLAWLLGASSPTAPTHGLLPRLAFAGDVVDLSFSMLPPALRGAAQAKLLYSADMVTWTTLTVPDTSGIIDGITFTVTESGERLDVRTSVPTSLAIGGRLFIGVRAENVAP